MPNVKMKQMPKTPIKTDMFQLLMEKAERDRKKRRRELLAPLGVKEFFTEGNITINKRTCRGLECKLCIKSCPTNALYWKSGEVGIIEELCIYCGACVLSCIVDDCIKIVRKRSENQFESFSKPRDFITLQHNINAKKRYERTRAIFPKSESYLNRNKIT
jgi:ferredoxin